MLHVTHDPEEAFAVGDRVAVMDHGRLVQCDTPSEMRRAPGTRHVAELIHHQSGGMNFVAGEVRRDDMDTFFECPFGRWPMSMQIVASLRESLWAAENFRTGVGKVHIMMGVAVEDVHCTTAPAEDEDQVRLELPVQRLESGDERTMVIAGDERGRWVGHAGLGERLEPGQKATMRFALADTYWFDSTTGRTLAAPAG
jgi:ABC-type sugar transport system ATPase subunit